MKRGCWNWRRVQASLCPRTTRGEFITENFCCAIRTATSSCFSGMMHERFLLCDRCAQTAPSYHPKHSSSHFLLFFRDAHPRTAVAQRTPKLVMGYPTPGAGITIEVIRRAGFFKKHGLDVDLVLLSGSSLLATAMISGSVPVSMAGAAPMVVSGLAGADTVLLACATAYAYGRLLAQPKITASTNSKEDASDLPDWGPSMTASCDMRYRSAASILSGTSFFSQREAARSGS